MNLIKLHRNYLFSKINLIIMFIVILIGLILSFILINPFELVSQKWSNRLISSSSYEQNNLIYTKILMVLFASYLFGIYFSKSGDDYSVLLLCKINKNMYFITKVMTVVLTLFSVILLMFFSHISIGMLFNRWYYFNINLFKDYCDIFLVSLSYGFLSLSCIRIFKSLYTVIIPFSLYLVSEIIVDYGTTNILVKIICLLFPTTYLTDGKIILIYGVVHLIVIDIMYLLLSHLIYVNYKE